MTTKIDPAADLYPTRLSEPGAVVVRQHPTVWGSPGDGPFDADALQAHEKRGFTILEDFMSPREVESYAAEL